MREPECPPGRKPHRQRIAEINDFLLPGKSGGIMIDNTDVHREFYLAELTKYPNLRVVFKGELTQEIYLIKVEKSLTPTTQN